MSKSLAEYVYHEWPGVGILYLGDCLEILPLLEAGSVDAVVTDPPYLNLKGGYVRTDDRLGKRLNPSAAIGDEWNASIEWTIESKRIAELGAFVFCTHHGITETAIAFSDWRQAVLLTWHKPNASPTGANVPRFTEEHIWGFAKRSGLRWDGFKTTFINLPTLAVGCCSNPERVLSVDGTAAHPTQKPIAVFEWLIEATEPESILDPFLGSGTTAVACIRTGRGFIGIELEPKYCAIAKSRIDSELSQPRLPFIEPIKEVQAEMFSEGATP